MVNRCGQLRKTRVKIGAYRLRFLSQEILEVQVGVNGHISLVTLRDGDRLRRQEAGLAGYLESSNCRHRKSS